MTKEQINELLEYDKSKRHAGVNDGLFNITELEAGKIWDNSYPTLVENPDPKIKRISSTLSNSSFMNWFYLEYPALQHIDYNNVLIAGGCVGRYFNRSRSNDVDIFIYGIQDQELANRKIINLMNVISRYTRSPIQIKKPSFDKFNHTTNIDTINKYAIDCRVHVEDHDDLLTLFNKYVNLSNETFNEYDLCIKNTTRSLQDQIKKDSKNEKIYLNLIKELENSKNPCGTSELSELYSAIINKIEKYRKIQPEDHIVKCEYCDSCANDIACAKNIVCNGNGHDTKYKKNGNCIEIEKNGYTYQIILRLYKTKSEILHGFDLGSSSIGFDGENVIFTKLGKFAYEYGCNIVDPSKRSTSYEHRLQKYFKKGFDIIFPEMDISKLDNTFWNKTGHADICKMAYFKFSYKTVDDNRILFDKFITIKNKNRSDYVSRSGHELDRYDNQQILRHNLYSLNKKEYTNVIIFTNHFVDLFIKNESIFAVPFIKQIYRDIKTEIDKGIVNVSTLRSYITVEDPINVFQYVITGKKDTIEDIIQKQVDSSMENIKEYFADHHVQNWWNIKQPMDQFTGSFKPIATTPLEWYSEFCFTEINK